MIGSPAFWGRVFNVGLNFGLGLCWEPATTGSATDTHRDTEIEIDTQRVTDRHQRDTEIEIGTKLVTDRHRYFWFVSLLNV